MDQPSDGYIRIMILVPLILKTFLRIREESPVLTRTKSKRATQKRTQGNVQEDTQSKISEGYVIEHIVKPPVTDKIKSPYVP